MRLVEVVMLMGAHCVSPVEHSQMMTDATKVQCAVVIERDTDKGTMTVTPAEAANDPQVVAAAERFRTAPVDSLSGGGTKIVPAWAPAGSPTIEVKEPVARANVPPPPVVPSTDNAAAAPPAPSTAVTADAAATDATDAGSATPDATAGDSTAADSTPAADDQSAPAAPVAQARAQPAPAAETKVATLSPPPQKRPPAKVAAASKQPASVEEPAPKQAGQCKGEAVAKWYKAPDGHKKYRCVKPSGDSAPGQLY